MTSGGRRIAGRAFRRDELRGYELLNDPLLNKGTAFSEQEREIFGLHGLLPPNVASLDEQVGPPAARRCASCRAISRYVFLRGLQDSNEVLFRLRCAI